MTATCTLCGELLKVTPDVRGVSFTVGAIGGVFRKHMVEKQHAIQPQTALEPEIFKGSVGQLIDAMGITAQGLILLTYLKSEDESFNDQVSKMRETVVKACQQKESAVPSVIV